MSKLKYKMVIKLLENKGFEDIKLELLESYIGFEKVTD